MLYDHKQDIPLLDISGTDTNLFKASRCVRKVVIMSDLSPLCDAAEISTGGRATASDEANKRAS